MRMAATLPHQVDACAMKIEAEATCCDEIQRSKSDSSDRARTVLTADQACEIFASKHHHGFVSLHMASVRLSLKYGVSAKAIRDIWTGRSWLRATHHLWDEKVRPEQKVIGRPKGRKDSKPRAKTAKALTVTESFNLDTSDCALMIANNAAASHEGIINYMARPTETSPLPCIQPEPFNGRFLSSYDPFINFNPSQNVLKTSEALRICNPHLLANQSLAIAKFLASASSYPCPLPPTPPSAPPTTAQLLQLLGPTRATLELFSAPMFPPQALAHLLARRAMLAAAAAAAADPASSFHFPMSLRGLPGPNSLY
jgi:hypothetical protein